MGSVIKFPKNTKSNTKSSSFITSIVELIKKNDKVVIIGTTENSFEIVTNLTDGEDIQNILTTVCEEITENSEIMPDIDIN